jgi:SNF2 family DNA or RNA helicase
LAQWQDEIKNHFKPGSFKSVAFDVKSKDMLNAQELAKMDIVITTYGYVLNHAEDAGPLHQIKWERIILDEAHMIRNIKSKTALACYVLKAKYRWALTGTPVQNSETDIQALFKFLHYKPFDNLRKFKKWYRTTKASELNNILQTVLLRRTKCDLQEKGFLTFDGKPLLEKSVQIILVDLGVEERKLYSEIFQLSKSIRRHGSYSILPYLTRLRQICDHPCIIKLVNIKCYLILFNRQPLLDSLYIYFNFIHSFVPVVEK